jgi:uncharacterized protein (TIGR03437 family)
MTTRPFRLLLLAAAAACLLPAQTTSFDNSGNAMLNGTYYFRQVVYVFNGNTGNFSDAACFYGTITFNGAGSYTMSNTQLVDLGAQTVSAPNPTGTYTVAASGQAFMTNPIPAFSSKDFIFGTVGQGGIFTGASTENTSLYNDLFIAAPLTSPSSSLATFKGPYSMAYFDLWEGLGALAQMSPDGAGKMGTVAVTGYVEGQGSNKITQNLTGATYTVSNGAAVVTFPTNNNAFFTGPNAYYLYFSPDGNFVFGGGRYSADMFVGVRTGTGTPNLSGLYYEAGLDDTPDAYYGSFNANNGAITGHERFDSPFVSNLPFNYTYSDSYSVGSNGTYANSFFNYVVGAGNIRIASGIAPNLGLNVSIPAPTLDPSKISTTGVYLNPTAVVNAGSFAPFTADIAPGELLVLFGNNLSAGTKVASSIPFPTTLNNTQVKISGTPAPLYYVTPTQLSAIVPYGVTSGIAQIQVINNNVASNTVTMFVSSTAPGILTQNQNGLGYGDVIHADGTLVNSKNPAQPGETVSVFLTGLGAVNPAISDGAAGPTDTYSLATNKITADVGGVTAAVGYAGLAPTLAGLYQVNLTIPASGVTAGDNDLNISGPDAYTSVCLIAIGSGTSTTSQASVAASKRPRASSHAKPLRQERRRLQIQ